MPQATAVRATLALCQPGRLQAEELVEVGYFDPPDPPTPMHPFCREALRLLCARLARRATAQVGFNHTTAHRTW